MGNIAPRWIQIASRCGNIGPTQFQTERERERDRDREREREERERERERQDPALHRPKWAGARLLGVSL